jgi:hypothetical protein
MLDILSKLAPTAATLLTGPLGGMAVDAIGKALGVEGATQDKIKEIITSGNMTPEQVAAIKKVEGDLQVKLKELDIKVEELQAADRASARDMFRESGSWVPAALSVVTSAGFFFLLVGAAAGWFELTGSDVMMLLLGVLARETASVYQFWLGSSSGSRQKTDMMGKK